MEPTKEKDCSCNATHDGPCGTGRVGWPKEYSGTLRVDPDPERGIAGAVQMWGVCAADDRNAPIALFGSEHAAWRHVLNMGRDQPPRGKFAPSAENYGVRAFMVSAAVLAR